MEGITVLTPRLLLGRLCNLLGRRAAHMPRAGQHLNLVPAGQSGDREAHNPLQPSP